MSRKRRGWDEPGSSHWEPGYSGRALYEERRCTPSTERYPRSFNYWQEEGLAPTPYHSRYSYEWESHGEQWRNDSHPRQSQSYSRRWRDFEPGHDQWDDPGSRRDRNSSYPNSSRHRYSTYPSASSIPPSAFRPIETMPPILNSLPPPPSPPPDRSSGALKPSPSYLAVSSQSSEVLHDPHQTRKLLVLDLNGTLLIRSARSRASSGLQLRPVQPRPYMQSFRQYLFCADTKAWLDTMVWSSAQPHSVDDMVDKVFGATKNELKAVWNRKSLGLSKAEYHQKTAVAKDLAKPWSSFASAPAHGKTEGHSAVSSQSESIHSAFTTLLLDDSPHKAVLQPYNHICIPEYNSMRRQHDLHSSLVAKGLKVGKESKKQKRKNQVETVAHSTDQMVSELSPRGASSKLAEKEPYDDTLLAIIGVLDAVKRHSNVAGWIRKGGLWATQERREEAVGGLDVKCHSAVNAEDDKTVSTTVVRTGNDASSTSDPAVTSEQFYLQTKMWFDDLSVMAYWVARGRQTLMELGIQVAHGVTG